MDEKILLDLGLSKNESKVYMTLIEIGLATGGQVAEKAKIHRTNVYDALERLVEKGLVSYILKEKTKYFEAADPSSLMNLLKEKEENLKKLLPTLVLNKQLSKKTEVTVSEGVAAARNALMNFLNYKEPVLIYGVPKETPKVLGEYFLERFQRERIKAKIHEKVIYNEDAVKRIKQLKQVPYCEIRALPKQFDSPMSTNICGDEVFFELFTREPCLTIRIKSKDIAELYKKYFEVIWNTAKRI